MVTGTDLYYRKDMRKNWNNRFLSFYVEILANKTMLLFL